MYKQIVLSKLDLLVHFLSSVPKVCKCYHLSNSVVFHIFSQFSMDIEVSQIHVYLSSIGFVTLVMKNFS